MLPPSDPQFDSLDRPQPTGIQLPEAGGAQIAQNGGETDSGELSVGDSLAYGLVTALTLAVLQRVFGVVRNVLFFQYLPDHELGQWSLVNSFLLIGAPLAVLGLPGTFGRYVEHYRKHKMLGLFLKRVTILCLVSSCVLLGVLASFPKWTGEFLFREVTAYETILLIIVTLGFTIWNNYLQELTGALRLVRFTAKLRFLNSFLFLAASIFFFSVWESTVNAVVASFLVSSIGVVLPILFVLHRNRRQYFSDEREGERVPTSYQLLKRVGPFAVWLWIINILSNLFEMTDRYMILHLWHGSSEEAQGLVGQYFAGLEIPRLLVGVATLICGILMPYIAAKWEAGEMNGVSQYVNLSTKMVAVGFTAICTFLLAVSPLLYQWLLNDKYQTGELLLPYAMTYCVWASIALVIQEYLWCAEKGYLPTACAFVALIVNAILNFILIPYFGVYGAMAATAIANGWMFVSLILIGWRNGLKVDWSLFAFGGLPFALWFGVVPAVIACSTALLLVARGGWGLSRDEQNLLYETVAKVRGKLSRN